MAEKTEMTKMEAELYEISCKLKKNWAEDRYLRKEYQKAAASHNTLVAEAAPGAFVPPEPRYPETELKALKKARRSLERRRNHLQRRVCLFGDPEKTKPLTAVELMNAWAALVVGIIIVSICFDAVNAIVVYHGFILEKFIYAVGISATSHCLATSVGLFMLFMTFIMRIKLNFSIEEYANDERIFQHGFCQWFHRCHKTSGIKSCLYTIMFSTTIILFIFKCESVYYIMMDDATNYVISHRAAMFLEFMFSLVGAILTAVKLSIDLSRSRKKS